MNKPKSTVIQLARKFLYDVDDVFYGQDESIARPGKYKVYREDGKIYLEVFHNEP